MSVQVDSVPGVKPVQSTSEPSSVAAQASSTAAVVVLGEDLTFSRLVSSLKW